MRNLLLLFPALTDLFPSHFRSQFELTFHSRPCRLWMALKLDLPLHSIVKNRGVNSSGGSQVEDSVAPKYLSLTRFFARRAACGASLRLRGTAREAPCYTLSTARGDSNRI